MRSSCTALAVVVIAAGCGRTYAPPQLDTPPTAASADERSIFESNLSIAARSVLEQPSGASVYRIKLRLADDLLHATGVEEVIYTNTEAEPLADLHFRLFPNILGGEMTVTSVTVEGKPATTTLGLEDSLLVVALTDALEPGKHVTIRLEFEQRIAENVDLNYGVRAFYGGVLALAHSYPMIAVHDSTGWNAEIPPAAGDLTFADMSYFQVEVNAPATLTLLGSGTEVESRVDGERKIVTFAAGPARDFYLAGGPSFVRHSRETSTGTVRVFAPQALANGALAALDYAESALAEFSSRFAPYPYSELEIVATPTLALGIEYPGVIAIADRILTPGDFRLEATVVHEVAHQWFYNLVGNDQLDDPWLDEALSQFATLQYFESRYGAEGAQGFRDSLEGRWERLGRREIPIGLPVAGFGPQEYGAIVYGRGPLFFDELRETMGHSTFDAFLRRYVSTFAWGIATPAGLQETAEQSCGCDLDALFAEWIG